jgi:riboflavin kinase / FMN adenylyltransferase
VRVAYNFKHIGALRNAVVAIGVFDGVHRAHRQIISEAVKHARRISGCPVVITFWPHPRGRPSLYSLEHRLRLLQQLGVGLCVVVPFTGSFASQSPEAFVAQIICKRLNAAAVYVGENFRFGRNASGDISDLARLLGGCGVVLRVFKMRRTRGRAISSSLIRSLISRGALAEARRLLEAPVSVYGHVVHGRGQGTALGYPTANIDPHHEITPPSGIYAVRIMFNSTHSKGVCYIGTRPTFLRRKAAPSVEVHILNFKKKNLYGMYMEAQFIVKIRDEMKFSSPAALISQIKKDIKKAKQILR